MSGRVGDLSPKQEAALAKVSPRPPGRAGPALALRGREREGSALGAERQSPCSRSSRARQGAFAPQAPRPPSSPPPERALGGTTWEEAVEARKPLEASSRHKGDIHCGAGCRVLGAGPQVSFHFREDLLLRGRGTDGKGPGQLRRVFRMAPSSGSKSLCDLGQNLPFTRLPLGEPRPGWTTRCGGRSGACWCLVGRSALDLRPALRPAVPAPQARG